MKNLVKPNILSVKNYIPGKPIEEVKAYYKKEELIDGLKEKICEEKTVKLLLDKADISEKEAKR